MISTVSTMQTFGVPRTTVAPASRKACAAAIVFAIATSGTVASIPMAKQIFETSNSSLLSMDFVDEMEYNNRSINLWWEGGSVMSSDKANNLVRIMEIRQLQDNWNGNNASKFSEKLLEIAKELVMNTGIQGEIFPTARDSIQFEYENEAGDYLELEVFEDEKIKVFSFSHDGKPTTQNVPICDINKVVNSFYGRNV